MLQTARRRHLPPTPAPICTDADAARSLDRDAGPLDRAANRAARRAADGAMLVPSSRPAATMDALSEVLKALHLTSGVFLEVEFTAPWCIDSAPGVDDVRNILPSAEHVVIYHLLTEGRCRARLPDGNEVIELGAGDLIMFPHGDGHLLGSDLQRMPLAASSLVEPSAGGGLMRIRHGGGGERTRFICGFLACEKRLCRPLLDALPRMLRVPLGEDPATRWLAGALQHGAAETHSPRPGSDAILGRLSELVFVESLRLHIRSLPEDQLGWLAGLREPIVARALALLHGDPARHWEVESLARECGVSRSTLGDRFVALLGEPPMQYLTRWRLALAARALSTRNDGVSQLAAEVGYESEAAFNRAFKREFGMPPAAWRRAVRTQRRLATMGETA
jgi:AraC-like DNA-binding protein